MDAFATTIPLLAVAMVPIIVVFRRTGGTIRPRTPRSAVLVEEATAKWRIPGPSDDSLLRFVALHGLAGPVNFEQAMSAEDRRQLAQWGRMAALSFVVTIAMESQSGVVGGDVGGGSA